MRFLLFLVPLLLLGCDTQRRSQTPDRLTATPAVQSTVASSNYQEVDRSADIAAESARLNAWFDEKFLEELEFSPQFKTRLGDKSDHDKLDDYSEAGQDRQLQWRRDSVAELQNQFDVELLNADAQLSYEMWQYTLQLAESGVPYRRHRYIFGRGGPHASLPNFLINYHVVETAEDMVAYLARLGEMDRVFSQLLERSQLASEQAIRQPRFAYDFAIAEIDRVTSGAPFTNSDRSPNSPLWSDIQNKMAVLRENELISGDEASSLLNQAREILAGEVLTAYQQIKEWLELDRELASEEAEGVWALPMGEDYYDHRLRLMTTTEMSADEIHEIGLSEVYRIRNEMEAIKQEVDFSGTLQEFFVFMREDEQFYYPNTDAGRQAYLDLNNNYLNEMTETLPAYFGRLPKARLEVRRVESFREQAGAAQHYAAGSPDGSRPGVFYSHMLDMDTLPIFQLEDVAYHEGNPGHHMQISIQQELTDVPRFRTQYRSTAYTEGWGLYAEKLAKEMGFYKDPYSDFGRLSGEIWRAIRLVVDTGIHAKQWSEEQAVQYFLDNSPQPESAVRSEVQRYFSGPGQATAYKIGMLKFQEVRAKANGSLGAQFDIREFHDVVLGAGALPLALMEALVERWVEATIAGFSDNL